jgi:hypothetical protein
MTTLNSNALCTEDNVREYLSNTLSIDDMDRIIVLINSTSQMFENYCNKTIVAKDFTEYYDGTNSNHIWLKNYPIISVTSMYFVDDINDETLIPATDYTIDGVGIYYLSKFVAFPRNIKVVYRAGYATVPDDIKQVCIEEVVKNFKKKDRLDISSIAKPDGNYNFITDPLLPSTKSVLEFYRNKFI